MTEFLDKGLDEEQHQQAAGEVEKVPNSVTRNFRHFRQKLHLIMLRKWQASGHPTNLIH